MADIIAKLKLNSNEYDSKIKRAVGGLQQMESECRKVGGTLAVLEKDQLEYVKALGRMETVSRSARGKLSELKEAFTELSVQYNRLTDEEKKGDFGKALSSSLEQLKTRIGESKSELDSIGKSLGDAGKQSQQTGGFMGELAKRFTLNIDVMKMFNVSLKAAETALSVAKDAFFASEANVDEWGRTVQAAQSVYEGFLTAINNGDVSGFLTRIDEIVVAARKAYNELDTLGTMKTIQAPAMSKQEAENQRIRTMLMTGRWISAADGRKSANGLKDGDLLSKAQLQQLERQLQSGMQNIVSMTKNEVKQTGRAIDAYYNSLAKNNGMSLAEFRQGTSSWAEFNKRIKGSGNYEKFENEHTSLVRQFNPIMGEYEYKSVRDNVKNPYQQYANWSTFRVDKMGKNSYNELVGLIRQQQQQQQQMYSTMGQAYRTVNRVEGITPRGIMGGGSGGSGGGGYSSMLYGVQSTPATTAAPTVETVYVLNPNKKDDSFKVKDGEILVNQKKKKATGTRYAQKGLTLTQEKGGEIITTKDGVLVPLKAGDGVIPAHLTDKLFKMAMNYPNIGQTITLP